MFEKIGFAIFAICVGLLALFVKYLHVIRKYFIISFDFLYNTLHITTGIILLIMIIIFMSYRSIFGYF